MPVVALIRTPPGVARYARTLYDPPTPMLARRIRTLAEFLSTRLQARQAILIMDTLPVHWHHASLLQCQRRQLWPFFVPAKLSWLLQPLDTHVFASLKAHCRRLYAEAQSTSAEGRLTVMTILSLLLRASTSTLHGPDWSHAFAQLGYGKQQAKLSGTLQRKSLQFALRPPYTGEFNQNVLDRVMPRSSRIPAHLLDPRQWKPRPIAKRLAVSQQIEDESIVKRLRRWTAAHSTTSAAVAVAEAASSAVGTEFDPCHAAASSHSVMRRPRATRLGWSTMPRWVHKTKDHPSEW